MQRLKDKIAIVTGAASGIGREMCVQLNRAGATVIAADVDENRLDELEKSIATTGVGFSSTVVDVADTDALRSFIDGVANSFGRIDYIFNIAGIGGKGGEVRDLAPQDWDRIIRINLMAVIHGSSFAYAHMRSQGNGHIVNMASAAGLSGAFCAIPYGTTKAAVVAFSRELRAEAESFGVKVTVLCPGFIESRIFENLDSGSVDSQKAKDLIPIKFLPTERAVSKLLAGVAANQPIVTLPGYVSLIWWTRRMFPRTYDRLVGRRLLSEFRKMRLENEPSGKGGRPPDSA